MHRTCSQEQNTDSMVPKTTAYKRWNCQVIRPENCCHLISSNRFLNGFPGPSQFAVAKMNLYSTMPHRPSDFWQPRQCIILSGDVHQNSVPAPKYPCSVCTRNITSRGRAICAIVVQVGFIRSVLDKLSIFHLEHLGSRTIEYLTDSSTMLSHIVRFRLVGSHPLSS